MELAMMRDALPEHGSGRPVPAFAVAAVAVAVSAALLAGCSRSHDVEVSARFADVGSLAPGAPVMMADVTVGNVTAIRLSGRQAVVSMSLDPSARVPGGVLARVRRTTLLGEQIVDLVVPPDLRANAPALRDGATIARTDTRPDLEDLVSAGNAVLAPLTASEVATLVDEGAKGFGGRGETLGGLLTNLGQIVHAYAGRTGEIDSVITSLDQLNASLAAHAHAQGLSVKNAAQALTMLRDESARLQRAIHALARLSVGARGILDAHEKEMARFFAQTRTILGVLQREQSDIDAILVYGPEHNRNTQLVNYHEFNQVIQDFVICGLNDDPHDPARRCR
jgi:phospholipid/cholesterol/gamma-HCH transport system substrate-binding protein